MTTRARRRKQAEIIDEIAPEVPLIEKKEKSKRGRAAHKIPAENENKKLNYVSHPSIVNNVEPPGENIKNSKHFEANFNIHKLSNDKPERSPITQRNVESTRLTRSRKHAFVEVTNVDIPSNSTMCVLRSENETSSKKSNNDEIIKKKKPKNKENKTNSTVENETRSLDSFIKNVEAENLCPNNESSSTVSFHSATDSPIDKSAKTDLNKPFDADSEPKLMNNVSDKSKINRNKSNKKNKKAIKTKSLNAIKTTENIEQETNIVTREGRQKIANTNMSNTETTEISALNEANQIEEKGLLKMDCTFDVANTSCLANQVSPQKDSTTDKLNTTFELIDTSIMLIKKQNSAKSCDNLNQEISGSGKVYSNNSSTNEENGKSKESNKLESLYDTTPILVDSSTDMSADESTTLSNAVISNNSERHSMLFSSSPKPPRLIREGTFTKEEASFIQDVSADTITTITKKTPSKILTRTRSSTNIPGTPHPGTHKRTKSVSILNLTHSIEKLRNGEMNYSTQKDEEPRQTKVMFCSPVLNGSKDTRKSKLIKSSMKGSNKSFVFGDKRSNTVQAAPRKRSFTHNDVEDLKTKKKKLTADTSSGGRGAALACATPPRPRSSAGAGAGAGAGPASARCRLPNFAAVHQRAFERMESLGEAQERKARRAHALLHPPVSPGPGPGPRAAALQGKTPTAAPSQPHSTTKFGFKLSAVNPFTLPAQPSQPSQRAQPGSKPALLKQKTVSHIPRLANAAGPARHQPGPARPQAGPAPDRRRLAKLTACKEKAGCGGMAERRQDIREVIKGVRTNRRFQLQMQMRNIN